MDTHTVVAFAFVAFVSIATPGPDTLLALSNGSRFGLPRALLGIAGVVLADLILIAVVATGLGALFLASEFLFSIVKWLGVGYLAFLGIRLLQIGGVGDFSVAAGSRTLESARATFVKAILTAISNPKNYLFFAALLPQFILPEYSHVTQYVWLSAIVVATDIIAMMAYAYFGTQIIVFLKSSRLVWLDRTCGAVFLVLSASLAFFS